MFYVHVRGCEEEVVVVVVEDKVQVEAKCFKRSAQYVPYFDSRFACFNKITVVVVNF